MCPTESSWSTSQCIVRRYPSRRARAKTSLNLTGGLPLSSESRPTPTIQSRVRQRALERLQRRLRAQVAQEAHDQPAAQAERRLGVLLRAVEALDDRLERHPARRVGLGVEEHLGVDDVLGAGLPEVRHREVVEVALGEQHAHPLVVDGEERGEIVEVVCAPHLLDGGVRKLEAVAGGELELQLGLERALEMHVELGLGQALDE